MNLDSWELATEFEVALTLRENRIDLMPVAKWAARTDSTPSIQTIGQGLAHVKLI